MTDRLTEIAGRAEKATPGPTWLEGLTHKDWLFDGYPIRGERMIEMWNGLDWSRAWVDMGPSIAGNPGPYWHVPLPSEETVHRLYPKVLRTKWLPLIRRAVAERRAKAESECAALRQVVADLLALPVAKAELALLDNGIGTATRNAAWLRARALLPPPEEMKKP